MDLQTDPREDIPYVPHHGTITTNEKVAKFDDLYDLLTLHGACDVTWASDIKKTMIYGSCCVIIVRSSNILSDKFTTHYSSKYN